MTPIERYCKITSEHASLRQAAIPMLSDSTAMPPSRSTNSSERSSALPVRQGVVGRGLSWSLNWHVSLLDCRSGQGGTFYQGCLAGPRLVFLYVVAQGLYPESRTAMFGGSQGNPDGPFCHRQKLPVLLLNELTDWAIPAPQLWFRIS